MNAQVVSSRGPVNGSSWLQRCVLIAATAVLPMLMAPQASVGADAATKPADALSIKGTCVFGGKSSTWSATLTPKGDNTYDADYTSSWGGKPLTYKGTIKSDFKTEISGEGKAVKGGNGTFQFAGKYEKDGIAKCTYAEVNGKRKGTLTAEVAKK